MTFAQALVRIEYLSHQAHHDDTACDERDLLLHKYADSIVQLAKVAQKMRGSLNWLGTDDALDTADIGNPIALALAMESYDQLMKGE